MEEKIEMVPDEVAKSAERQLINLKKAQDDKMKEVMDQREYIVELKRTIQALIYAAGNTYKTVYPGAEGFVEGRIKTPDSIATKTRNEFTEILSEIKENPNIDQKSILEKISKIDFKDIVAFSVITTIPPKKFRTGSDELNSKLSDLAEELERTSNRIKEHKNFIQANEQRMLSLSNEINEIKANLNRGEIEYKNDEKIYEIKNLLNNSLSLKNQEVLTEIIDKVGSLIIDESSKQNNEKELESKTNQFNYAKENVEYGQGNLSRTNDVYTRTLRELQYEMSAYFVSNLAKFSSFKFWGTEEIRQPKLIKKPGFRAVNTGYSVIFSNDKKKYKVKFEAQGKGHLDYNDAEFTALGAGYHEEQKTKDGLISKKTDMPDFTIIGAEQTARIEKEVRRKYQDLSYLEDFADNLEEENIKEEYEALGEYEKRIREEIQTKFGDNLLSKKKLKRKMHEAFIAAKESLIQKEIETRIDKQIYDFANSDFVKRKIQNSEELTKIYDTEKTKISASNNEGLSKEEIEQRARTRVVYYTKEKEIENYAKSSIPMFFRANLSSNQMEEVMVYWFSTGESIYRYFINKLNGLKDENGKYKYEPQEQQKKALLKLTGLFKEDEKNFYTYNKTNESFGGLEKHNGIDER